MGEIFSPYGIKGWVKIRPYTESMESLLGFQSWWLGVEGEWQKTKVCDAALHGKSIVAKLEGVEDRSDAERLKGELVAVPRQELPEPSEGEYYWRDLVGMKVVNLEGLDLGVVEKLLETGANDVLEVKGGAKRLIPFIESVVLEVDLAGKTIKVDWGADY